MKKKALLTLLFLAQALLPFAQDIEIEKTYEISGKAKRGNLAYAEFDASTGNYLLTYVTKANAGVARFELYRFDKDFNFVKLDNQEFEFDKAKKLYPWWKFRGETYHVEGITAMPNLTGALVLRKYNINYTYEWELTSYFPKYKMLDKVKLRSDEGDKYFYMKSYNNVEDGNLFVLAGLKKDDDKVNLWKNYHLMQINTSLNVVKDLEINFDYPQFLVGSKLIVDDNDNITDMLFLFAPANKGKNPDPQKNRYTYIRVNNKLELIDRINLTSPANYWDVYDIEIADGKDEYYLYGPALPGKDDYYDEMIGTDKYKSFQIAKISNHKVDYLSVTNLYEFESKLKTPPDQRQSPAYDGKKFDLSDMTVTENGDLFIVGQTWGGKFNAISGNREFTYKDFLGFHFDKSGNLIAQYGVDAKENSGNYMAPQVMVESDDGKYLYWLIQEVKGVKGEGIGFQIAGIPQFSILLKKRLLTYPRLGKIDLAKGAVSEFVLYGKEKYFSDNNFPILKNSSEKKVVLFGSNKAGNVIYFVRISMD